MKLRPFALAAVLVATAATSGDAFAPHKGSERPIVVNGRAPRAHRSVTWTTPKSARLGALVAWHGIWDRDTGVPLRLWGPSIAIAGSTARADIAEAAARRVLAEQLATLAPGAQVTDFALAANVLDPTGTIRTVTFAQHWAGLPVVGGAVGFTFERDHLVMLSSTALPGVAAKLPGGTLAAADVEASAQHWLFQSGVPITAIRGHGARVVLPLVRAHAAIEYRVAETVSVESGGAAGRWDVWIDAIDGAPIARRQTLAFATGTVDFDVPDQSPSQTRSPHPAPNDTHTINGAAITSALDGTVTWATAAPATVTPGLSGPLVAITNVAGALVTGSVSLADGGTTTWSEATDPESDAQLDAFVFASHAKQFAKTMYNPNLAWLGQQISVNVNENETCNAFSTGDDIHFFQGDTECENTGRIADVVYHEFGHSVHYNSIIPGEGVFDAALSEGMADTNAITITGDHGVGRGFFYNDTPLRDEGDPNVVKVWPADADGEPHDEGEIIAEALWDTRQALQTKLGTEAGYLQFIKVYYSVVQRSPDIPSALPPALLGDDDDGDLSNGTPNTCEIVAAFAKHGLADPSVTVGLHPPTRDGSTVTLAVTPPSGDGACPAATVTSATITWAPHGGTPSLLALATTDSLTFTAQIPTQPDQTVVDYHVTVNLSDGSTYTFPQNPADPDYQMYFGAVTPIKCFDFEDGGADWVHSGQPASQDEWQVGVPLGMGGDPASAHGGQNVLGIDLGADDGLYAPNTEQWVTSPEIDLGGATNVRLQYYRWLNVEDGFYDQGTIYANGTSVWANFASPTMPLAVETNHTDSEWRFADVDLSPAIAGGGGTLTLKFELDSDPGLELGGWTIDDLCVVTYGAQVGATCGNGVVDPGEQCDDGNTTNGDGCSSACQTEGTGPIEPEGGGCCSANRDPSGALALSVLTIGLVLRRRRAVRRPRASRGGARA